MTETSCENRKPTYFGYIYVSMKKIKYCPTLHLANKRMCSATKEPLYTLNNTLSEFVVTPIDQCNDSVAFISQRFFALVLTKRYGLNQNITSTNKIYFQINNKNNNYVISDNTIFLKNEFDLKVNEENKKLTNIYRTANFINIFIKLGL